MGDSTANQGVVTDGSRGGSLRETVRGEGWKAGLVFLVATPVAFVAFRDVVWESWEKAVLRSGMIEATPIKNVAYAPWSVIVTQALLALLVGGVLAVEYLGYSARRDLLPDDVWMRNPLPSWIRGLFVVVWVALCPLGIYVVDRSLEPVTLPFVEATNVSISIVKFIGLLGLVAILTALALQSAFVGSVIALIRIRSP